MNNFNDYEKFFKLRKEYPNLSNLISELIAAFFKNNDSFPPQFYIYGSYSESDINTVLKQFGISTVICTNPVYLRNADRTLITISK